MTEGGERKRGDVDHLRGARAIAIAMLCGAIGVGCDRRVESWVEPEAEPPAPAHPVRIPGLDSPKPPPRAMAPAIAPPAASAERPAPPIRGVVRLAQGVEVPAGSVLYLVARDPEGGPPVAVRKLASGPFPMPFEIGPGDVMLSGRPFSGPVVLTARIDRDGDPLTREPDEPAGGVDGPVAPGTEGIELMLDVSQSR